MSPERSMFCHLAPNVLVVIGSKRTHLTLLSGHVIPVLVRDKGEAARTLFSAHPAPLVCHTHSTSHQQAQEGAWSGGSIQCELATSPAPSATAERRQVHSQLPRAVPLCIVLLTAPSHPSSPLLCRMTSPPPSIAGNARLRQSIL